MIYNVYETQLKFACKRMKLIVKTMNESCFKHLNIYYDSYKYVKFDILYKVIDFSTEKCLHQKNHK